jgi:hypothetical protein
LRIRGWQRCYEGRGRQRRRKTSFKRVARRTPKKKTSTPAPVVDKDYFTKEYKSDMLRYRTDPYNKKYVLAYMNIGNAARQKRERLYIKFIQTLYLLRNKYLSPEEFIKSDGKLYKWETNFKVWLANYGGMGELALSLGRMKDQTMMIGAWSAMSVSLCTCGTHLITTRRRVGILGSRSASRPLTMLAMACLLQDNSRKARLLDTMWAMSFTSI